jgi:hypothetical protein
MKKRKGTDVLIAKVRQLTAEGVNSDDIGTKLDVSRQRLNYIAKRGKFKLNRPSADERSGLPPNLDEYIREWYLRDLLSREAVAQKIQETFNVKRSTAWVKKRLATSNIRRDDQTVKKAASLSGQRGGRNRAVKVSEETEDKVVALYLEGHASQDVADMCGLRSGCVVTRILRSRNVHVRNMREALEASPKGFFQNVPLATQHNLITDYDNGDSLLALEKKYGYNAIVIKRVFRDHNVEVRTPAEAKKKMSQRYETGRRQRQLETIAPRLEAEAETIRRSILIIYKAKHLRKFRDFFDDDEVVARAMTHTPRVAMRWNKPDGGDNFVWFVATYSLIAFVDELRSESGFRRKSTPKTATQSLNRPVAGSGDDSLRLSDTLPVSGFPVGTHVEWEDTKGKILWEAKEMVKTQQLRQEHVALLRYYYFPIAETGHPIKSMTDIGKDFGVSESRISQLATADPRGALMRDMIREVVLGSTVQK